MGVLLPLLCHPQEEGTPAIRMRRTSLRYSGDRICKNVAIINHFYEQEVLWPFDQMRFLDEGEEDEETRWGRKSCSMVILIGNRNTCLLMNYTEGGISFFLPPPLPPVDFPKLSTKRSL